VVGDTLTPQVILKFVGAFATIQKGKRFIVGRDSRVSGPWVLHLVHGTLMSMGYNVIDIGIVPTPTVSPFKALIDALVTKLSTSGSIYR